MTARPLHVDRTTVRFVRLLLLVAALFAGVASAATPTWSSEPTQYIAERKDLREFLRELATSQGFAIVIDPEVKGTFSGRFMLTPRSLFEMRVRDHGLIWYYDGRVMYVYPATAIETQIVRLEHIGGKAFEEELRQLGIADDRFPLRFDSEQRGIFVSGPRRYVELVQETAAMIDIGAGDRDPATVTVAVPLRYAFADDHSLPQGGREVRVAGVVSVLRQLYPAASRSAAIQAPGSATNSRAPQRSTRIEGTSLTTRVPPGPRDMEKLAEQASIAMGGGSSGRTPLPVFAADPRTNAVLVRDIPSRVDSYREVIRGLDVRPAVVEIETSIIEVNSDDLYELGLDWRFVANRLDAQVGTGQLTDNINRPRGFDGSAVPSGEVLPNNPTVGDVLGGVMSTIIGDRRRLILRISALREQGRAKMNSQPKVMTLNNIEALLETTTQFFVRVNGFQDAGLFNVSFGTSIRVTPAIASEEDGQQSLRLLVKVEDGSLTDARVDEIPVILRSAIATQALIDNGSSLLIAGYSQEKERDTQTGVPVLSQIPILGKLFQSRASQRQKVVRLFLITPRIVGSTTSPGSKETDTGRAE